MEWPYILIIIIGVLILGWFFYYIGTNKFQNKMSRFFDRQEEKMVDGLRDQVLNDNPDVKRALDKIEKSHNEINKVLDPDKAKNVTYMDLVNDFINKPATVEKKVKNKRKKKT